MLIDQGDADQFLAGQLQPAVLAEAAPEGLAMTAHSAGYDRSYYFIASFIEDHLRFRRSILFGVGSVCALMPLLASPTGRQIRRQPLPFALAASGTCNPPTK